MYLKLWKHKVKHIHHLIIIIKEKKINLPITIPCSLAAFVAFNASLILSLISLTSISEAPPTLIMPTPPFNLARRSRNFSLSYSEVELLIYSLISSTLASISFLKNSFK